MKKKYLVGLAFIACFFSFSYSHAQLSITAGNTNFTIDFDNTVADVNNGAYAGSGFQPTPTSGQLDSNAWEVIGFSSSSGGGSVLFGGTNVTLDFARGTSTGGLTTGGLYSFDVSGSGDNAFGIQPGGTDFTPGTATLRIVNNTGHTVTSIDVSYEIWVFNDQGRGNSFNFSYSTDNSSFTNVAALDFTSTDAADVAPAWSPTNRNTTITGVTIPNGGSLYIRWSGDDISGSGSRDEFALDDIVVNMATPYSWTGTTNNDWATGTNWDSGSVPPSSADIVIPNTGVTNYPTISSSVTANSITINSGASLIANASVTGATTYNRNLGTTNWYLISSPVAGESILDFRTNNTFASGSVAGRIGLAPYDNTQASGSRWAYQTTSSTGNLDNGQGFSVKLAAAGDLTFTGTVNSSNILKGITIGAGNAFNLVGNPFTAFLNTGAGGFLADNSGALTSQTLWVWNQATNSYETKVTADNFKLAPGQGFFVECGTAGDVTFETADLSHEGTDTFQRNSSKSEIHLMISTGKENSKTKFYFIEGATKGFDNGYDGKMFNGVSNNFAVYSQLINDNKGVNYAIQSLPKNKIDGLVIPTGLNAKANKEIEFSIDTKKLPENIYVYLEDRLNDKFINLSESTYKTTLSKDNNGIGQFYIHTTSRKLDTPLSLSIDDVSIYKSAPNTLTIVGLQAKASVKLFSILGKEVMQKEINSNGVSNIDIPSLSTGVYLVEIASEKGKSSKKIILD